MEKTISEFISRRKQISFNILENQVFMFFYGMLFENVKNHLLNTFGRYGIFELEIEGMLRKNYHSNRGEFGSKRMEIYGKKEEGKAYRGKYLKGYYNDSSHIKQEANKKVSCFNFLFL